MGIRNLEGLEVRDPFMLFGAEWETKYAGVLQSVDNLHVLHMGTFYDGTYHSIAGLADHFARERPDIGYQKCTALLDDLQPVLQRKATVIKALKPHSTNVELLALSESQSSMVRSHIIYGELQTEYAKLLGLTIALEGAMQQQAQLESLVEEYIPKERQLFLLGNYQNGHFTYTLKKEGDRLQHDVRFTKKPLQTVAQELEGNALYKIEKIPSLVTQQFDELRRFLLTQYASIKRQISREGLPHYPLLFPTNA
jgi:hypothetical protein